MIHIPHGSFGRLSRIYHACDKKSPHNLNHIGLTIVGDTARICATNGRILVCGIFDAEGETDRQVVLDAHHFTMACKSVEKNKAGMATLLIGSTEARLEADHCASIIRLIDGTYPVIDVILRQHLGMNWIPSVGSIDPDLMTTAQRIIGRPTIKLATTVNPGSSLPAVWESVNPSPVTTHELGSATRSPSFWRDGRWLVLLMPNTRTLPDHVDLGPFVLTKEPQMAVA